MFWPSFSTWVDAFSFGWNTVVLSYPIIETLADFIRSFIVDKKTENDVRDNNEI